MERGEHGWHRFARILYFYLRESAISASFAFHIR